MGNRKHSKTVAHFIFSFSFLLLVILAGCAIDEESESTMPARDINTVMEAHTQSLMSIEGVVGVAISENEEKAPCIMVLLRDDSEELLERIPKSIEGHPVCPFVSGEIKPLSDS